MLAKAEESVFKETPGEEYKFNKETKQEINFVDQFNKLTSVFHASVLLLIINFVITLSK